MEQGQLNWVANFIWGIADDVLRDLSGYRRKYRDVILPMTVLRRLDAVLEPTKQAVLDMKVSLDKAEDTLTRIRRFARPPGRTIAPVSSRGGTVRSRSMRRAWKVELSSNCLTDLGIPTRKMANT